MRTDRRDLLILIAAVAAPATCVYCAPAIRQVAGDRQREATGSGVAGSSATTADRAGDSALHAADTGPDEVGGEPSDPIASLPPGELLARAEVDDLGEVRLEAVEGGFALRLVPAAGKALDLEPIARLEGSAPVTLFMGPGCRAASDGRDRVVALWTGEQALCVTDPEPVALLRGRPPPPGCPIERAAPGRWTLALYACGRLVEPAATLAFDLPGSEPGEPLGSSAPPEDGR